MTGTYSSAWQPTVKLASLAYQASNRTVPIGPGIASGGQQQVQRGDIGGAGPFLMGMTWLAGSVAFALGGRSGLAATAGAASASASLRSRLSRGADAALPLGRPGGAAALPGAGPGGGCRGTGGVAIDSSPALGQLLRSPGLQPVPLRGQLRDPLCPFRPGLLLAGPGLGLQTARRRRR